MMMIELGDRENGVFLLDVRIVMVIVVIVASSSAELSLPPFVDGFFCL